MSFQKYTPWFRVVRSHYSTLLLRPLKRDSTIQHIAFKSSELLEILQNSKDAVIKLQDQDVRDIQVMMERLPEKEGNLYKELGDTILQTRFLLINTELMLVLLDLYEKRVSGSKDGQRFLSPLLETVIAANENDVNLETRTRLYDIWALHSNDTLQTHFYQTCPRVPSTSLTLNLKVQTELLKGNYLKAFESAKAGLERSLTLDRYTVELVAFHLLHHKDVENTYTLVNLVHSQVPNPYTNRYLPLSNHQLGQLISLSLIQGQYRILRSLINKFCVFQRLHFIDQGSLMTFLKYTVQRGDLRHLNRMIKLLRTIDGATFGKDLRRTVSLLYFQLKYRAELEHRDTTTTAVPTRKVVTVVESFKEDMKVLGVFGDVRLCEIPICVDVILAKYPLHNTVLILSELDYCLSSEKGSMEAGRLMLQVVTGLLSKLGRPEMILPLLGEITTKFADLHLQLIDHDVILHLIRSYHQLNAPLTPKSANFIVGVVSKKQGFTSKTYRLVIKLLKSQYQGPDLEKLVLVVLDKQRSDKQRVV